MKEYHAIARFAPIKRLLLVFTLGLLWMNVLGCGGKSSEVAEKEAVRLAKEHFVQKFPNSVYDDVYIESGGNGSWIAEFRTMEGRTDDDLEDGRMWLKSPVIVVVDSTGKCAVQSDSGS